MVFGDRIRASAYNVSPQNPFPEIVLTVSLLSLLFLLLPSLLFSLHINLPPFSLPSFHFFTLSSRFSHFFLPPICPFCHLLPSLLPSFLSPSFPPPPPPPPPPLSLSLSLSLFLPSLPPSPSLSPKVVFRKNVTKPTVVCEKHYNKKKGPLAFLKERIHEAYMQQWVIDNMPVTWCYKILESEKPFCTTRFPIGCYVTASGQRHDACFLSVSFCMLPPAGQTKKLCLFALYC